MCPVQDNKKDIRNGVGGGCSILNITAAMMEKAVQNGDMTRDDKTAALRETVVTRNNFRAQNQVTTAGTSL